MRKTVKKAIDTAMIEKNLQGKITNFKKGQLSQNQRDSFSIKNADMTMVINKKIIWSIGIRVPLITSFPPRIFGLDVM